MALTPEDQELDQQLTERVYEQALSLLEIYGADVLKGARQHAEDGDYAGFANHSDLQVSFLAHLLAWSAAFPDQHPMLVASVILGATERAIIPLALGFDRKLVEKGLR